MAGLRPSVPVCIEQMRRISFLPRWDALADEALEDALYDSQALRNFVGLDLGGESVPDATTLLKFRHEPLTPAVLTGHPPPTGQMPYFFCSVALS